MTREEMDMLAEAAFAVGDTDPAVALARATQVIEEASASGYEGPLAKAHHVRGCAYSHVDRYAESDSEYRSAISFASETDDVFVIGRSTLGLGSNEMKKGNFKEALTLLEQALAIGRDSSDMLLQAATHNSLSVLYLMIGLLEQSLLHADAALELTRGTTKERYALGQLSFLFSEAQDFQTASRLLEEALVHDQTASDHKMTVFHTGMLADTYAAIGDWARAAATVRTVLSEAKSQIPSALLCDCLVHLGNYEAMCGNYEDAALRLNEAQGIADVPPNSKALCNIYFASLETKRGNPKRAIEYLHAIEVYFKDPKNVNYRKDFYEEFARACEAIGDAQLALHYLKEFHAEQKKIVTNKFRNQLNGVQILRATEREKLEKELAQMKSAQLERDLANSAIHLAAQTDVLAHFRDELRQIVCEIDDPINALKKIKERLKALPCEEIDWLKFENEFISVHPEFRKKLEERFPELTKQEARVCQLLRVGLKSFEVGRLICVSERGVENHRFNIRKKLGLKTEQSLTKFLQSI